MRGTGAHRREVWIPLIQCAWCRRIMLGGRYYHLPRLGLLKGEWELRLPWIPPIVATLTHSVCRPCAREIRERAAAHRSDQVLPRRKTAA